MKKKTPTNNRTTRVRGISFPIKPIDTLALAEKQAKRNNRNVSNYIVELILQDHAEEENANG